MGNVKYNSWWQGPFLRGSLAAGLLLMLGGSLQAQTRTYRDGSFWVEETTGTLPAGKMVRVRADLGSVVFDGSAAGGGVTYMVKKRISAGSEEQARRVFDSYHFVAANRGETDQFTGDFRGGEWRRGTVQIIITAPRQQDLVKVSTDGGDVTVVHDAGRAEVDSGGGKLVLDDIGGEAVVSSGGGNVQIGNVAGDVRLRSGGGNLTLASGGRNASLTTGGGNIMVQSVKGDAVLESGGGNITVRKAGGGLRATTGGGSLDLGDVGGIVAAETGGGSIRINSGTRMTAETGAGQIQCYNVKHGLRAETAAGGIVAEFIGNKSDFSDSHLEAGTGDIVVYLPNNLGVTVRASIDFANGHNIRSEFAGLNISQSTQGYGPQEISAEGDLNGGGPTLKLHTTTGDISLRRIKKIQSDDSDAN